MLYAYEPFCQETAWVCKPDGTSRVTLVITGFSYRNVKLEKQILWTEMHWGLIGQCAIALLAIMALSNHTDGLAKQCTHEWLL